MMEPGLLGAKKDGVQHTRGCITLKRGAASFLKVKEGEDAESIHT